MNNDGTFMGGGIGLAISANVTLCKGSDRVQYLTPLVERFVVLPDATKYSQLGGPIFYIVNGAIGTDLIIKDKGGNEIYTLHGRKGIIVLLIGNDDEEGDWAFMEREKYVEALLL